MIRNVLKEEIQKIVKTLYDKESVFDVSLSPDGGFGDYASNVAMALGVGGARDIAEKIKEELEKSDTINKYIKKIDVAGHGFLNFYLSDEALTCELKNLFKKPHKKFEKINLEFISANPTGKLHIGHGRGAFYGDVLANVLEYSGYGVEREYYINDAHTSTQIKELGKTAVGKGKTYLTDYIKSKINALQLEDQQQEAGYLLAKEVQKDNQGFIGHDLGIKFDNWFSEEEELYQRKMIDRILVVLEHKKLVYERDGAKWLKTSEFGDDEDRVVIRSDGSYSYFAADIAYHQDKVDRGFDSLIDIWGADHQGHIKRMMAVHKMLEWRSSMTILVAQMVALKEDGKLKKLSKREGTVILLDELLGEVGLDALRWFYLSKTLSTHMEFDVDLAREESKNNPVYYVQYAHARISSILVKSKIKRMLAYFTKPSADKLIAGNDKEKNAARSLIKKLLQFDEVMEDTANDYQVNRITTYVYELAQEFTKFYENARVIGSGKYEFARIYLIFKTQKTLKIALGLLGINAPDKM